MVIADTDIVFYTSAKSGGTPQRTSLGGAITSTAVDTDRDAFWDFISGAENAAKNHVDYRILYIKNKNGTDTAFNIRVFLATPNIGTDDVDYIDIALGTKNVQAAALDDESDSGGDIPAAIITALDATGDSAVDVGNALPRPPTVIDLEHDEWIPVYLRRRLPNNEVPARAEITPTLNCYFDKA